MEDHVLRKLGATLLALPVLALVYLAVLGRQGIARVGAGVAAAVVVAIVALASVPPAQGNAVPVSATPAPVAARVLDAIATGHGLKQPFTIEFDAPMDAATVAAALRLQPDAAVSFDWDEAGRVLTIAPVAQWQPGTLYALTVADNARAVDGGALAADLRSVVLTDRAGTAALAATRAVGDRVRIDSAFRITLDRPAPLAAVTAALRIDPPIRGEVAAGKKEGEFVFTPAAGLDVNATYRLSLDGLADADGVAFGDVPTLVVRTTKAPRVVRFRPRAGDGDVARTAAISVRFTDRMDKAKTEKAFRVTAGSRELDGDLAWAEGGSVLVFVPADPLPYGVKVVARVGAGAASRAGVAVDKAASATFTVVPKPKPAPVKKAKPVSKPSASKPISKSGGGAVKGNWSGVEAYYLRLMNCTRTGGWVTSNGSCSSPGGRNVAPLVMSSGISARVSRPYAKLLATRGICNHFIGGNPGDRLRRAGYTSYRWGENLGCRSGNPYSAVLGSHRFFQSEKPYNGGHYRNLMDARYRQVGIGVWVSGGSVRLVVDFYTP
jgi:uncharacterized protein YkwD